MLARGLRHSHLLKGTQRRKVALITEEVGRLPCPLTSSLGGCWVSKSRISKFRLLKSDFRLAARVPLAIKTASKIAKNAKVAGSGMTVMCPASNRTSANPVGSLANPSVGSVSVQESSRSVSPTVSAVKVRVARGMLKPTSSFPILPLPGRHGSIARIDQHADES